MPHAWLARLPPPPGTGVPGRGRSRDLAVLCAAPIRGHLLAGPRRLAISLRRDGGQLIPETAAGVAVLHRQHRLSPRTPLERRHSELQPAGGPRDDPPSAGRAGTNAAGWATSDPSEALG